MFNRKLAVTARRFASPLLWSAVIALAVRADVSSVTETTIYSFSGTDGSAPSGALIQASDGNFYGTAQTGGPNNIGTVFQISSTGSLTTLHSFAGNTDGSHPSANLVENTADAFYGTTRDGGGYNAGTLFEVTSSGTLATQYAFTGGNDGAQPLAGLIQASDGNYYGTTSSGGVDNAGTVFQFSTGASSPVTLYSFTGGSDGAYPEAGLVQASDGNLYGTAFMGGANNCGTLFEITLPSVSNPTGTFSTLYTFTCGTSTTPGALGDEGASLAGLVQGPNGTDGTLYLYGTTSANGLGASGTVFQVAISGAGKGTLTTLHAFAGADGASPMGTLLLGSDGNLYGTTSTGGANNDGTVYWLSTNGQNFDAIYNFSGSDGADSVAGLVLGSDGNLYGVTATGGLNADGGVFKLVPTPALAPPLSLSVTPAAIYLGQSTTLAWSAANASGGGSAGQCFANGSWSGSQAASGTESLTPTAAGSFTYKLTCGGVETGSTTLTVNDLDNPGNVAIQFGDASVEISWSPIAAGEGVSDYEVVESSCNNIASPVATVTGDSANVTTATGGVPLVDGTTYYFKVVAANSAGTSNCTNATVVHATPMQAPTNLTAAPGDSQATLSWTLASGAASYQVYSVSGTTQTPVTQNITCSNGSSTDSCTITDLTDGTTYTYTVASQNPNAGVAESAFSVSNVSVTPVATPTGAPTGLKAAPGNDQVVLTFSPVVGASGYDVYEETSATGGFSKLTTGVAFTTNSDGTVSATVTGLTNGTTYTFLVDAVNSIGAEGPKAGPVSAVPQALPAAPTGVTATPVDGGVDLTWLAVTGATSYELYQGTASGKETLVQTNIQSASYKALGLADGTAYYFEIVAVNPAGVSPPSKEVSATPVPAPPAPTGVTASAGNDSVTLNWIASPTATSYNIFEEAGSQGSVLLATGVTATTYTATGLSNGQIYVFGISAMNASGTSATSTVSAEPEPGRGSNNGAFAPEMLALFGLAALWRRRMTRQDRQGPARG